MSKNPNFCTKAELRKREEQAVGKTLTIFLAALMDEYDLEKYDLELVMERFTRYSNAIDEHLITVKQVSEIIKEQTGVDVKWH